jgi:hypothetical protein
MTLTAKPGYLCRVNRHGRTAKRGLRLRTNSHNAFIPSAGAAASNLALRLGAEDARGSKNDQFCVLLANDLQQGEPFTDCKQLIPQDNDTKSRHITNIMLTCPILCKYKTYNADKIFSVESKRLINMA